MVSSHPSSSAPTPRSWHFAEQASQYLFDLPIWPWWMHPTHLTHLPPHWLYGTALDGFDKNAHIARWFKSRQLYSKCLSASHQEDELRCPLFGTQPLALATSPVMAKVGRGKPDVWCRSQQTLSCYTFIAHQMWNWSEVSADGRRGWLFLAKSINIICSRHSYWAIDQSGGVLGCV